MDEATLTTEPKYPINFTQPRKKFVLSLHYSRSISFVSVNAAEICQFNAKDSWLGNISKETFYH